MNPNDIKGLLMKGESLFYLEEYEFALETFKKAEKIKRGDKIIQRWIRKCNLNLINEINEVFEEGGGGIIEELENETEVIEEVKVDKVVEEEVVEKVIEEVVEKVKEEVVEKVKEEVVEEVEEEVVEKVIKPEIRWDWYQSVSNITINFYKKDLTNEDYKVKLKSEKILRVKIKTKTVEQEEEEGKEEFFEKIFNFKSEISKLLRFNHSKMKLEIVLKKNENIKWPELEEEEEEEKVKKIEQVKKWDKIKIEDEEENGLHGFLSSLYGRSSEEVRRAMNKSYLESGGTVLSTNWSEVGSGPVKGGRPEDFEKPKPRDGPIDIRI